jgi:glycosyltransferase involved in cell wall biosynthesis
VLNIWIFPKWYINRTDPQMGVFIRKHAIAIAQKNRVSVLYVHSLDDIADDRETEINSENNLLEVRVYYKKSHSIAARIFNLIRYIKAFRHGVKILKQHHPSPNVIIAYILLRPALMAWYYSKRMRASFVVSEQWSGYVTGQYSKKSSLVKKLTRVIVRNADALTCVSAFLLDGMKKNKLVNSNSHITSNTIEITSVPIKNNNPKPYVLIVADLVDEIKNISSVIRMVAAIRSSESFELHIVGHGRDEQKLKKLVTDLNIDDIVFFEGVKSNSEVYDYLKRCDFLVMNSRFETFSLICAEAMSCGKPVLATRCGGPNDFVSEETGVLIEPGNDFELQTEFLKMIKVFPSYDQSKIMEHARKLFSADVVAGSFEQVFKTLSYRGK